MAPPGRLYQSEKKPLSLQDTHAATDVQVIYKPNFDSPQKAINFFDELKRFYVTLPDYSAVIIYEIYETKMDKKGINKVEPMGFSFLPLFQYVEMGTSRSDNLEIYINTAIHQLMIFKGRPDEAFINKVINSENFLSFLTDQVNSKQLEPIPKMSLIVKLFDNQFENIFQEPEQSYEKTSQDYMIMKNPKNLKFHYRKDFARNKSGVISKLLGKNLTPSQYETNIYDYIEVNVQLT